MNDQIWYGDEETIHKMIDRAMNEQEKEILRSEGNTEL